MKTLILITVSLILGLLSANAQTQTTSTSETKTNIIVYSDEETKEKGNFYNSFSTIDMDNYFRIKARFMESKTEMVKNFLIAQLGEENLSVTGNSYIWKQDLDDDEVYEIRLSAKRLRINLDKTLASDKLFKKFKQIGKELKMITARRNNN